MGEENIYRMMSDLYKELGRIRGSSSLPEGSGGRFKKVRGILYRIAWRAADLR